MPSGPVDKSKDPDSHEAKYGYGHEEWLSDTSKIINGFHYGFLEPIRKEQDAFQNKIYDVWLYSINGKTKKRFWVGDIKNLIVIDKDEANEVKRIYIKNGWLTEMEEQIQASGANPKGFSNWKGVDLFNVKFKPTDIDIQDPYFELSNQHPIVEQSRYAFAYFRNDYQVEIEEEIEDDFEFTPSTNNEGGADKKPVTKTFDRQPKAVEIIFYTKLLASCSLKYCDILTAWKM